MVGLALAFLAGLGWVTVSVFPSDAAADTQYHECTGGRCDDGSTESSGGGKPQQPHPPCESRDGCGGEPSETAEPSETWEPSETAEPSATTEPSGTAEPTKTSTPSTSRVVVVPPPIQLPPVREPEIARPDSSGDDDFGSDEATVLPGSDAVAVPGSAAHVAPPASGGAPAGGPGSGVAPGPGTSGPAESAPEGPTAGHSPDSDGSSEGAQSPDQGDPDAAPPGMVPVVHSEPLPAVTVFGGVGILLCFAGGAGALTFKGARAQQARIAAARAEFFPPASSGGV
ncbi:cell surface protein [Rhodococcus wratislaviensis]|nr:cell surface protein [Rhodococcus sp. 3A]MBC2892363.1 cell surface protein [Rhodococcus sp. 4CII]